MNLTREEKIQLMATRSPNTFAAVQNLVMAFAGIHKSQGKRPLFGRSPAVKAHAKMDSALSDTLTALRIDGYIQPDFSDERAFDIFADYMILFSEAFPNWLDAYQVAADMLFKDKQAGIEYISRRR